MAPFRYTVKPRALVNCFEPKQLPANSGQSLRASMFGAYFIAEPQKQDVTKTGLSKLPDSDNCRTLWEAGFIFMSWRLFDGLICR